MKKTILIISTVLLLAELNAQNLVINPDAESLPRGSGWTIVSQGALTCLSAPTNNIINWTMKPDGSSNYPYDHTTGASGGTVFFSGCDTYFQGSFELYQTIDISADAALIDLGNELYSFSGYMQTPVSNQTDEGRFIVDYLNAANAILGTSYNTGWQSYFGGSGTSWTYYNDTRIAPAGSRKIKIRMQAQILFNQPAINVYFDDIALTKPVILPLTLLSFTGREQQGSIHLNWTVNNERGSRQMELEQSSDATHFNRIASFAAGKTDYHFTDNNSYTNSRLFYRLKMTAASGEIYYSQVVMIKATEHTLMSLSPNPANNSVMVNGSFKKGIVSVINSNGQTVLTDNTGGSFITLNISGLPAGLYVVRFSDQKNVLNKKLVIQRK